MRILLFTLATILCSCSNKQQKMITNYIKNDNREPKSYESIVFGSLDSTFTDIKGSQEFKTIQDSINFYKPKSDEATAFAEIQIEENSKYTADEFQKLPKEVKDEKTKYLFLAIKYNIKLIELEKESMEMLKIDTTIFTGFKMSHKYRIKNEEGNVVVNYKNFFFDKELSEIISTENF